MLLGLLLLSKKSGVLKKLEATLNTRHVTAHELGHLINGLFMMLLIVSICPDPCLIGVYFLVENQMAPL